jgi:hypothetical protein
MRVHLGDLARTGLETRVGSDLPAAVNAALVYYVGKLASGRRPVPVPPFLVAAGAAEGAKSQAVVEVTVDERIEAVIYREASRQGATPDALAHHAVLIYLAELDLIGEPQSATHRAAQV